MILSFQAQTELFLSVVLLGAGFGLLYDLLRTLRKTLPHKSLVVHLEDALYWICLAVTMFFFMLEQNQAQIRIFSVFGAFLGMVLYFATFSKPIRALLEMLIHIVIKTLGLIVKLLYAPLHFVGGIIFKPIYSFKVKAEQKRKKWLRSLRICAKIKYQRYRQQWRFLRKKR